MKALKVLNHIKNNYITFSLQPELDEAIKELEALDSRSCGTCKWEEVDLDEPPCDECNVRYSCCWEAKQ